MEQSQIFTIYWAQQYAYLYSICTLQYGSSMQNSNGKPAGEAITAKTCIGLRQGQRSIVAFSRITSQKGRRKFESFRIRHFEAEQDTL